MQPGIALTGNDHIAVRSDIADVIARGEVALLSGGGAGHEPAHAGYVGAGMLSAAVSGDVFTSPSTDAVLNGIRAIAGPGGVLLIVKNYTGDRLNFGLAAELARAEGIAVEMVVVGDDVALESATENAGRRGLAGTVLVHKIAGAAAAAGLSLAEVRDAALAAIRDLGTMGVGLTPCTVPAAGRPGFELGEHEIELGLGIHGEAGVRRTALEPSRALVDQLVTRIATVVGLQAGEPVALLVNNLGGTPSIELSIVAGDVLSALRERGLNVERAWCGTFLTALEMAGVSVSVLPLRDPRLLGWLDAPAATSAWPAAHLGRVPASAQRLPEQAGSATPTHVPGTVPQHPVAHALQAVCDLLTQSEPELTRMDQVVGDGDLGISLARGAQAVREELGGYPLDDLAGTLRALSATLRRVLGGTSGPLYAIMLLRAAAVLETRGATDNQVLSLALALKAGCDGISEVGGAKAGDRTMLDALIPATQAFQAAAQSGATLADALAAATTAAHEGTAATAQVVPRRGRSSYLGERALGHPDPGAHAIALWLGALQQQASRT